MKALAQRLAQSERSADDRCCDLLFCSVPISSSYCVPVGMSFTASVSLLPTGASVQGWVVGR